MTPSLSPVDRVPDARTCSRAPLVEQAHAMVRAGRRFFRRAFALCAVLFLSFTMVGTVPQTSAAPTTTENARRLVELDEDDDDFFAGALAVDEKCSGSFSDFSWGAGNYVEGGIYRSRRGHPATLNFKWTVNDDAVSGDTFSLKIPKQLEIEKSLPGFKLYASDGSEVADVTWKTVNGVDIMMIKLSSYVDTHSNVTGTAHVSLTWNYYGENGLHDLEFVGCDGHSETLKGELLPEPNAGIFQISAKSGTVSVGHGYVSWSLGLSSALDKDYKDEQLVVRDPGGDGYVLTCENLRVANITPAPYDKVDYSNLLDKSRYSCRSDGDRGIIVTFNKNAKGNYVDRYETIWLSILGNLTPDYVDYDKLHNVAYVDGGPRHRGEPDNRVVPGEADVPGSGGIGDGKTVRFDITKIVEGSKAPADARFTFEYKCRGDDFTTLPAIGNGEKARSVQTKSSATCVVREKDIPAGVTVAYEISNPESGAQLTDNGDGSFNLSFKANSDASVQIKATNTFPDKAPAFAVEKSTTDKPVELRAGTRALFRTYHVKVTNTGEAPGKSPEVFDFPQTPQGFELESFFADGKQVQLGADGKSYLVTSGDQLDVGASKEHIIGIKYNIELTDVDIEALGQCSDDEESPDPEQGIYNLVTMKDDTDGPENNDACTTAKDRRGIVRWKKVDAATNSPLAGTEWTISNGALGGKKIVIADCVAAPDEHQKCVIQPQGDEDVYFDADPNPGSFVVIGLPATTQSRYRLTETKAPEGYAPISRPETFLIYEGTPEPYIHTFTVPFKNYRTELRWFKVDADTKRPLAGTKWSISGDKLTDEVIISDCVVGGADPSACTPTDPDQKYFDADQRPGYFLVEKLPVSSATGSYTLKEVEAPEGYGLLQREYKFSLNELYQYKYSLTVGLRNQKTSVTWKKVDAGTKKPLAGSKWSITEGGLSSEVIIADCVADTADACKPEDGAKYYDIDPAAGSFKVRGLPVSDEAYKLKESEAPQGYKLLEKTEHFTLNASTSYKHDFEVAFENETNVPPRSPHLPLTGGTGTDIFLIMGGLLAGIAGIAGAFEMRRRRRNS
ncbi:SpaA isopeptide-forming pilin-related protein [Corynebacterium kutscheri]|uniref:SpaA isopeptide-forming pilin-related protein n=1 Tax=Corynebacterium kutscheri TaxID=35755 RepID=UPI0037C146E3